MKAHEFHELLRNRMKEKGYGDKEIRFALYGHPDVLDVVWDEPLDCFVIVPKLLPDIPGKEHVIA